MIDITVFKQSDYPVSAAEIKKVVKKTLVENGIVSDCVVEVAIVSDAKMDELNKNYYKDEEYMHPVFTFPETENSQTPSGPFVFPPDGKLHLGEIIISYPQAVERSRETGKLINEVISDLAQHGALHLVGIHHD
ncbi:MAG TPA: rRNA maturation RNase YbeY [Patescibacteria group bacterium]